MRAVGLTSLLALTACAPASQEINVRGQDVPTAIFVFFDKDSANPQSESMRAINEAAAFLVQYDNTVARIVGHIAPDEPQSPDADRRLDTMRSVAVAALMMQMGVQNNRIQPVSMGYGENMSSSAEDREIDRRVDIIFSTIR
jgi:outer membrane protein OmpA-like peptidoglycan-associated protein